MNFAQLKEILDSGDAASDGEKFQAVDFALAEFERQADFALPRGLLLHESMGCLLSKEELRLLFDAVKLNQCCARHMSSVPVAIDSDEVTAPHTGWYTGCQQQTRHAARFFKRAFDFELPEDLPDLVDA